MCIDLLSRCQWREMGLNLELAYGWRAVRINFARQVLQLLAMLGKGEGRLTVGLGDSDRHDVRMMNPLQYQLMLLSSGDVKLWSSTAVAG